MNYDKMSDFELNKLVAKAKGLKQAPVCPNGDGVSGMIVYPHSNEINFDPCNNPSDAWPIIVDNGISIVCTGTAAGPTYSATDGFWHHSGSIMDDNFEVECNGNPLRAAMICFLKMKDAEK